MRESQTQSSNPTREISPRMFKSDFLEYFSHVHPYTPLVVFAPVIIYFMYQSFTGGALAWWATVLLFAGGVLIWSFLEYVLHRYIFHLQIDTEWGRKFHFFMHGVHHDYPQDETRLVMPPGMSIPLAVVFYFLFRLIFGEVLLPALFAGLVMGYVIYDTSHYAIHHYNFKSEWWKKLKHHHMKHHFMDSDNGFGVSSMLWDYVFQTYRFQPKKKKASAEKK